MPGILQKSSEPTCSDSVERNNNSLPSLTFQPPSNSTLVDVHHLDNPRSDEAFQYSIETNDSQEDTVIGHFRLEVENAMSETDNVLDEQQQQRTSVLECSSLGENARCLDVVASGSHRLGHSRRLSSSDEEICQLLSRADPRHLVNGVPLRGFHGENTAFCPIEILPNDPVNNSLPDDRKGAGTLNLGRARHWRGPPSRCHVNRAAVIQRPSLDFDKMQRNSLAKKSTTRRLQRLHIRGIELEKILQQQQQQQQQPGRRQLLTPLLDPAVFSFRSISLPVRGHGGGGSGNESR